MNLNSMVDDLIPGDFSSQEEKSFHCRFRKKTTQTIEILNNNLPIPYTEKELNLYLYKYVLNNF